MDGRFSETTASVVARARAEAQRVGSGVVGTEHLLLGLLGEPSNHANKALLEAGATLDGCRSKVVELVGSRSATPIAAELDLSDRARRTLERADRLALRLRAARVEPEHVLVSLLDVEGRAGQVLRGFGVDVATLRKAVSTDRTSETKPVSEIQPVTKVETSPTAPRCARCGADLGSGAIAHTVVRSQNAGDEPVDFVLVYCSACGTPVGTTRA